VSASLKREYIGGGPHIFAVVLYGSTPPPHLPSTRIERLTSYTQRRKIKREKRKGGHTGCEGQGIGSQYIPIYDL
jgi:hypothetical protein